MASPIAYCSSCGTIFQERGIFLGEGCTNITLTNNSTRCPNCGEIAKIADGVFNAAAEALEIVKAPALTQALYKRFASLIEEARAKEMMPEEFVARANAINPEFGKAAETLARSKAPWLVGLALLLALLNKCNFNVDIKLDANQLIEQVLGQDAKKAKK
jgi:hypothetical protein